MAQRTAFKLTTTEKSSLKSMLKKGVRNIRVSKRAMILLKLDAGLKRQDIATQVGVAKATVYNIRNAYKSGGLQEALYDKPRPGKAVRIHTKAKAKITALACSDAPAGYAKWTLRLLADKAVELGYVERISHEQVRQILKKMN